MHFQGQLMPSATDRWLTKWKMILMFVFYFVKHVLFPMPNICMFFWYAMHDNACDVAQYELIYFLQFCQKNAIIFPFTCFNAAYVNKFSFVKFNISNMDVSYIIHVMIDIMTSAFLFYSLFIVFFFSSLA